MTARATIGGILASVAVLVIGWQVGAGAASVPATSSPAAGSSGAPTGALKNGTYDGAVE